MLPFVFTADFSPDSNQNIFGSKWKKNYIAQYFLGTAGHAEILIYLIEAATPGLI